MEPKVILTGFADEGPPSKRAEAQLSMCRALGLSYYSPRFVDCGQGVKNLMALTPEEISFLKDLHDEYEMKVSSVGSPIGKVKLLDIDDGTHNRYVPFDQYLETEVAHAIELAETFGAKLIRGFSFYGPKQDDPRQHVAQAAEYLRAIAEKCDTRLEWRKFADFQGWAPGFGENGGNETGSESPPPQPATRNPQPAEEEEPPNPPAPDGAAAPPEEQPLPAAEGSTATARRAWPEVQAAFGAYDPRRVPRKPRPLNG